MLNLLFHFLVEVIEAGRSADLGYIDLHAGDGLLLGLRVTLPHG